MQELAIFIAFGGAIIAYSLYKNQKIINTDFTYSYLRAWTILKTLMIAFFFGYMAILVFVFFGYSKIIQPFSGILFFLVALFVYITVSTGIKTLNELHMTTVSKEYVDKIVDSMADTLIVIKVDPDLRISKVNKATLNLLEYQYNELINQPITKIFKVKNSMDHYIEKFDTSSWLTNEEAVYITKGGTEIPVLLSMSCIKDSKDSIEELIIAAQDIEERVKYEKALKASEKKYRDLSEELNQSNILKNLLLDVIAHDLRNPIGTIKGFAEYEIEKNPNNDNIQDISTASDKLLNVIDNATNIARVATGDEIIKEELDFTEMIKELIKDFAKDFKSKNMTVDVYIEKPYIIRANPIISEIFHNYITNAIKYGSAGGKLIVNAAEKDNLVTFEFGDFGDTIPRKERKNIFKRNIQLKKTVVGGLGLAIVDRIADAHNAEVGVTANKPNGNIFYLKISK